MSQYPSAGKVGDVRIGGTPTAVLDPYYYLLYVFYPGYDDNSKLMYSKWDFMKHVWTTDLQVPNTSMTNSPSVAYWNRKVWVFYQGSGDNVSTLRYNVLGTDGKTWLGDTQMANTSIFGSPAAVVDPENRLCVFYRKASTSSDADADGTMAVNVRKGEDVPWVPEEVPSNARASESPSAVSQGGKLWLFYRGYPDSQGVDKGIWYTTHDDNGWTDVKFIPDPNFPANGVGVSYSPSAVSGPAENIFVYHHGWLASQDQLWRVNYYDDLGWRKDQQVTNGHITFGPGTAWVRQFYACFYRGSSQGGSVDGQLYLVMDNVDI